MSWVLIIISNICLLRSGSCPSHTPRTLNTTEDLKESAWGPWIVVLPKWLCLKSSVTERGLKLKFDPKGDFGSHRFLNRCEKDGYKLLPGDSFPYYNVGNLNKPGAEALCEFVQQYNLNLKDNRYRVIFSLNNGVIVKVYVTKHSDKSCFNPNATFCIDIDLLKTIRDQKVEDLLSYMNRNGAAMTAG